ncbi:predicted protein [Sclerotinia sclerotiorum 1980 UF-70]|uniref:Uncharacterized protein n=1 Tax=Sclerotinia sclerotiorum (strain ATCC 18683 / 1980 / Ss-1) TaxID=665079 RepID=A7EYW5_SCLS1|nr:predicted protein [Sclerotinia sclerotiorum 1980 UF-70]EDN94657.1 predicted protein [Sclerotinia sclerotiorum 1980 UF-70]
MASDPASNSKCQLSLVAPLTLCAYGLRTSSMQSKVVIYEQDDAKCNILLTTEA